MYPTDLESWDYYEDDDCPRYISGSGRILIMLDPFETEEQGENQWFWAVFDDGVPDLPGGELLEIIADEEYDHYFAFFDSAQEAYQDMVFKGMERS